jgi:hypothetical protein
MPQLVKFNQIIKQEKKEKQIVVIAIGCLSDEIEKKWPDSSKF